MNQEENENEIEIPTEFKEGSKLLFDYCDKDNSGEIDYKEFKQFLELSKIPKSRAKYMFPMIDTDHSGKISYKEYENFVNLCYKFVATGDIRSYVRFWFDFCDEDKDQALNMKEFVRFIKCCAGKINVLNRKKQFKEWDRDGNGKVDFEEIMSRIVFKMKTNELSL